MCLFGVFAHLDNSCRPQGREDKVAEAWTQRHHLHGPQGEDGGRQYIHSHLHPAQEPRGQAAR